MSLDKFRKIEDNKGQFLPDNELEIYGKDPIKTSFGKWPNDTLRVIIYDGSNNPLPQKDWGLVRYINQEEFPQYYKKDDTIVSGTTKKYSVDIRRLIKDAGYNIGIFTVETMFINSRLGTEDKPNRVWIQEISPSRTEVRVLPFDLGDVKYKNTNILLSDIVAERYTAFLDDEEFKEDIWESIEPFLDLITVNDIRQLFINRVTEPLYQQILREYFNNDINVFNKVIFDVIHYFKLAVRHELDNLDSTIGYGYNQLNLNFGKPNTRDRVTVDFPQFCFDTLLVSLDCFVPVIVDFFETEIDDDIRTNEFTEIRPRVTIPTVRDPNPTTTTLSPDQTTTTTDAPIPPPDRGQGKVKVRLWSNLPKNLNFDLFPQNYSHAMSHPDFNMEQARYNGGIEVQEYDVVTNQIVPVFPSNYDWVKNNPVPEKGINETFQSYSAKITEYYKTLDEITTRKYFWTDAKMVYAKQKSDGIPVEPFDGYYDCYRNNTHYFPSDMTNRFNHTIPAYYIKSNGGPEKNIEIFKGNVISLRLGRIPATAETIPMYGETNNTYMGRSSISRTESIREQLPHYKYRDKIEITAISGPYPQAAGFQGFIVSDREYYIRPMKQGAAPTITYETEMWAFEYLLNLNTGEKFYPSHDSSNFGGMVIEEDTDLMIKFRRIGMFHVGEHLYRAFPDCGEPALIQPSTHASPVSGILILPNFDQNNVNFGNDFHVNLFGNSGRYYWERWYKYVGNAYSVPYSMNTAFGYIGYWWYSYKKVMDYTSVTDPDVTSLSLYDRNQPQNVLNELATADYRERDFI